MKIIERNLARDLRKKGKSINQIVKEANLSKASVSFWVKDIVLTASQQKRISERGRSVKSIERRRASRLFNENQKRQIIIDAAGEDFNNISIKELKIIGAIFYWAEGGKTKRGMARVANSDPAIIKVMMRFFREVCTVKEERFRAQIHTHSHLNISKSLQYWSGITGIPIKQFFKTYAKPSVASKGKRDSLPYGTVDIVICDTKLFLTIKGWIQKISELILDV
jgi:predicted transcriptional regulator